MPSRRSATKAATSALLTASKRAMKQSIGGAESALDGPAMEIVPMFMPSVLVRLTLSMATVILSAAGLGFLGLGAQPPLPKWGAMIDIGRRFMLESWWLVAVPGAAILCVSLTFNLMGERSLTATAITG